MNVDPDTVIGCVNWSVQLIGLLSAWKQDRKSESDDNFQDFMIWLENHNFNAIKERILESEELHRDLNSILQKDLSSISEKLDLISEAVMAVSRQIRGFDRLLENITTDEFDLSDQACSILRQFAESHQTDLIYHHIRSHDQEAHRFHPSIKNISEPRLIKADLDSLLKFGYLKITGYTERDGTPKYSLTRPGVKFAAELARRNGSAS